MNNNKIFIIGLPRTGTTSLCHAFLQLGFKTAHTAYTQASFEQAQVIADTPVFCDFTALDKRFTNAKFIYLTRELSLWLPSIKQLLQRMQHNLLRADGGFNPHLKRCYLETFAPFGEQNIHSDKFLTECYQRHQQQIEQYFANRTQDLLTINIADTGSIEKLHQFLNLDMATTDVHCFTQMNIKGKVTAWNDIKHPLKVNSTRNGKIDKKLY